MENFWWSQAFSTWAHLKLVSPKWRENSVGGVLWVNDKIAHCTCGVREFVTPIDFTLRPKARAEERHCRESTTKVQMA